MLISIHCDRCRCRCQERRGSITCPSCHGTATITTNERPATTVYDVDFDRAAREDRRILAARKAVRRAFPAAFESPRATLQAAGLIH